MAKSPIGKIVKSLYLEIAYVWTRPYTVLKNEKCAMKAATLKLKKKSLRICCGTASLIPILSILQRNKTYFAKSSEYLVSYCGEEGKEPYWHTQ